MRAVTWQGRRSIAVTDVPDPHPVEAGDAVIEVTSTAICGSDLHLYEVLGPFMSKGDVLGHEAIGVVTEVGSGVTRLRPGDRVVVPFNVACGTCVACRRGLQSQCETTQVSEYGTGGRIFGYSSLYGSVPGGQAEYLRVPFADYGPIPVPVGPPDERYLYLSDILPTAWQAVAYTGATEGQVVAIVGLGPVGQLAGRVARHRGLRVIGVEPVAHRRETAAAHGVETLPLDAHTPEAVLDLTRGRGADATIDAVGMEAHGSPAKAGFRALNAIPAPLARKLMRTAGVDALDALLLAVRLARRGGTVSVAGVYGGQRDPLPMFEIVDRQLTLRAGQCNVRRWTDDLLPLVEDPQDPLDLEGLATHRFPLESAPEAYRLFQNKDDGCLKVVMRPDATAGSHI